MVVTGNLEYAGQASKRDGRDFFSQCHNHGTRCSENAARAGKGAAAHRVGARSPAGAVTPRRVSTARGDQLPDPVGEVFGRCRRPTDQMRDMVIEQIEQAGHVRIRMPGPLAEGLK